MAGLTLFSKEASATPVFTILVKVLGQVTLNTGILALLFQKRKNSPCPSLWPFPMCQVDCRLLVVLKL